MQAKVAPAPAAGGRLKPPWRVWTFAAELQGRAWLQRDRAALGRWMTGRMAELGPAFVKLGQFLSTRSDVLGREVADELAKLQDRTAVVPFDDIQAVLRRELGGDVAAVFETVDPEPLASASIGQVHRARLRTKRGGARDVAIKVRKPGVRAQIRADLATLQGLARGLAWLGAPRAKEMDPLLAEYERFLTSELDYTAELAHMRRFADFFDADDVRVPRTYPTVSSAALLVMEYLPATKINDLAALDALGADRAELAGRLVTLFARQITELGYLHTDAQPGNLGVLPDGRTIVLYDYGNVVAFGPAFRAQIGHLLVAVVERDVDEFVALMEQMGMVTVRDEVDRFELKAFFRIFFDYLQNTDFDEMRGAILDSAMLRRSTMNVAIDSNFFALFRVFSLLDGTCTTLAPSFNYVEVMAPLALSALRDPAYLDYRVRRDVGRANGDAARAQAAQTQEIVVGLNGRLKRMADQAAFFRGLVLVGLGVELLDDPVLLLPALAALALAARR